MKVKMNLFRRSLVGLLSCFMVISVFAQEKQITGTVKDAGTSELLPGVSVVVVGTTIGTITDFDGNYKLNVPSPDVDIAFSFIGYESKTISIQGKTKIDVDLNPELHQLEEVVAVGYGTVRKKDITGSVASVSGDDLVAVPVTSAAEAITGRLAGVQVTTTDGAPDAEIKIRVRGGGSITQDNSPLFIVDGFPVDNISDIPASEIKSIDVLKDASSTAIYGSRGANGVVIITTKGGETGKVSVSYNAYTGFKDIAKTLNTLDVEDYVTWQYEYAALRYGSDKMESYNNYFGTYEDIDLYSGLSGNNWQEQIYGRTGTVFNQDLSVTGGSEKFKYAFSYANIDNEVIMIGSNFKRNNFSLKLNHKPNNKIDMNFSVRYSDADIEGGGSNVTGDQQKSSSEARLRHAVIYTPIPLTGLLESDVDDELTSSDLVNPFVATADAERTQNRRNLNTAASFSWEAAENLKLKTEVGLDNYYYTDNRFYGLTTYYSREQAGAYKGMPAVRIIDRKKQRIRNANTINYDFKKFLNEDHSLSALLGQETTQTEEVQNESTVLGYPKLFTSDQAFKLTSQGQAATVDMQYKPDDHLLSFFGRVNYNYKGKYIFSSTFRADGSSKFSKDNYWGYFPSAALAWRISSESFMERTSNWLDDMKLRLSYGSAGNNNIPSNQIVQSFESKPSVGRINGVSTYWAASKDLANPDLKWETTYTRNLGIDYSMLGSRLTGSFEFYWNTTKDLLIKFPVAGTGYENQYRNMGETENKGIEAVVNWVAIDKKNYGLNVGFNIGMNRNKINSLGIMEDFGAETLWASTEIGRDFWVSEGGSVGEMYGYLADGRYEVSDFESYNEAADEWILKNDVADASDIIGEVRPGTMKIKSINGTTNEEGQLIVTTADRSIIGDSNPLHSGGLNLSGRVYNFDISAAFSWSYGNDVYNANKMQFTSTSRYQYRNMIDIMEEGQRWTNLDKETGQVVNDPETLAAMNANTTMWSPYMQRYVFTDWAVEDGSFLRLNTLTLGYTLPSNLLERVRINNLRFYATCHNVFILTNYSGYDPDVSTRRKTALTPGVDYSAYPKSRQFIFGLNLKF